MYEEVMKYINSKFQKVNSVVNINKNSIKEAKRNSNKYRTEMWDLEYELLLYRRKRTLICFKHYALMILTCGIHTALFKKQYDDEINDIEGNISENMHEICDLQKDINDNLIKLISHQRYLHICGQYYRKLRFSLSLLKEEKKNGLDTKWVMEILKIKALFEYIQNLETDKRLLEQNRKYYNQIKDFLTLFESMSNEEIKKFLSYKINESKNTDD